MKNLLLCLCVGFCTSASLFAQGATGEKSPEAKGRVALFVYTSLPEGLENPVTIMSGKTLSQVGLSKRVPSAPVEIPADGIIRIVRKDDKPKVPGATEYITLAEAKIPEGMNQALVILIPAGENPRKLLFDARVQDFSNFKKGGSLYLNMTNLKVGVELGSQSVQINPGEVKILDNPGLSEPTNMLIRYSYFEPTKEKWKMISGSTVAVYPNRREMCIFSWDKRFNRIDYTGITFTLK